MTRQLPTGTDEPVRDREAEVYARFLERARGHFGALVTPDLIEEHRQSPLGHKSPALLHLLDLLRQAPLLDKLAVYAIEPDREFQIIRLSGEPGVPNDTRDPARYTSEEEVLHEVFLRRLAELDLIEHETPEPGEPSWPRDDDSHLIGYTDRLDARPGETVEVHLSADRAVEARLELVRLGVGDANGVVRESLVSDLGVFPVTPQSTLVGSSARTGPLGEWSEGLRTLGFGLLATTPKRHPQLIVGQRDESGSGWALSLRDGRLSWETIDGDHFHRIAQSEPLTRGAWYSVALRFDAAEGLLVVRPMQSRAAMSMVPADEAGATVLATGALTLGGEALDFAGWSKAERMAFNGRLETPFLSYHDDPVAVAESRAAGVGPREIDGTVVIWDPARALAGGSLVSQTIPALVKESDTWVARPELDAQCVNTPTWGVTSSDWNGHEHDFRRRPEHWAAVHFHEDDLDDAKWDPVCEVQIPPELPSGVYGIKATADGGVPERLPIFVEPLKPKASTRSIAVIIPTASYAAYANDHPGTQAQMAQATASRTPVLLDGDLFMHDHPELGRSCYDSHADGSGVGYASVRRPLLNMRPTHRYHVGAWQLPADLRLLSWLEAEEVEVDVITDHTLHRFGVEALVGYRVVMTASHSEYYSTSMLDAVSHYIDGGGRFLYLGANGFYWRVAFDADRPWVMELRRGENGSRAWQSRPGEMHHAFTGERGGLWASLGRPSYETFGVGFSAQGFDDSGWYRKLSDAEDPRAHFVFAGVEAATFGHEGLTGGAAGQETDRYDRALGTPPDTLLLATSEGLSEGYLRTVEDIHFLVAGTSASVDHQVRADITYRVNPAGGAVFSTGSIAWCQSLGLDEDVGRITRNVIKRFDDPVSLPW